jgi:ATP-dependent protease HslVU (ClpYQ) peptidase subunit
MGGDRAMSDDNTIHVGSEPKVRRVGGYLFGEAGTGGMCERFVNAWQADVPSKPAAAKAEALRIARTCGGDDPFGECSLIVCCAGRQWQLQGDGALWGYTGLQGVGNGAQVGMGAARAAMRYGAGPREAIREGLRQAAALCLGVKGPFDIVSIGNVPR